MVGNEAGILIEVFDVLQIIVKGNLPFPLNLVENYDDSQFVRADQFYKIASENSMYTVGFTFRNICENGIPERSEFKMIYDFRCKNDKYTFEFITEDRMIDLHKLQYSTLNLLVKLWHVHCHFNNVGRWFKPTLQNMRPYSILVLNKDIREMEVWNSKTRDFYYNLQALSSNEELEYKKALISGLNDESRVLLHNEKNSFEYCLDLRNAFIPMCAEFEGWILRNAKIRLSQAYGVDEVNMIMYQDIRKGKFNPWNIILDKMGYVDDKNKDLVAKYNDKVKLLRDEFVHAKLREDGRMKEIRYTEYFEIRSIVDSIKVSLLSKFGINE